MNININISDSSESQTIHLLTQVIECLQIEKTNVVKEYEGLKDEKAKSDVKLEELNKEYEGLKDEKAKSDVKLEELNKEYEGLKDEKAKSDVKLEELEELYKQEKTNVFIESIKQVSLVLRFSLQTNLDTKWHDYIKHLADDIDNFIQEVKTFEDIKLKIVSKNGWLSKVVSIKWWSVASSVKDLLPIMFQNDSVFDRSFYNLQNIMKELGLDIKIPTCDFSDKIENYTADYDGDTIVKTLFPQYSTEQFVLCEINFISYNGHTGKCIGYTVN